MAESVLTATVRGVSKPAETNCSPRRPERHFTQGLQHFEIWYANAVLAQLNYCSMNWLIVLCGSLDKREGARETALSPPNDILQNSALNAFL